MTRPTRRTVLGVCGASVAGIGGCLEMSGRTDGSVPTADSTGTITDSTGTTADSTGTTVDSTGTAVDSTGTTDATGDTTDGTSSDTTDGTSSDAEDGTQTQLDLREANVVDVTVTAESGDKYRLAVTLYHDDDGENGYANWWQAETTDGSRVGRRELLHAHGTRRFTRSTTITTTADCLVVRGHDQTHGYGGRAALVSLPDGTVSFRDQGSDPTSFADADCG